jgi:CRP-like cAMP-binding protein
VLTPRQARHREYHREILWVIEDYWREQMRGPTRVGIGKVVGLRDESVTRYLEELRAQGEVTWNPRARYSLRITD